MQKILVPTDFSKCAENALEYAIHLASVFNAQISLLNVYQYPFMDGHVPSYTMEEMIEELKQDSLKRLEEVVEKVQGGKLKDLAKGIPFDLMAVGGGAVAGIVSTARKNSADFIVMGTTGASGLKKIIGSIASEVIRKSPVPVFSIPPHSRFEKIRNVVYATDYKHHDIKNISLFLDLTEKLNAKLTILHLADPEEFSFEVRIEDIKDHFWQEITSGKIKFRTLFSNKVIEGLEAIISEGNAQLMIMVTQSRNILQLMFSDSISRKIVFHLKIPLLTFHEKVGKEKSAK